MLVNFDEHHFQLVMIDIHLRQVAELEKLFVVNESTLFFIQLGDQLLHLVDGALHVRTRETPNKVVMTHVPADCLILVF